jgi:hypothetical protein
MKQIIARASLVSDGAYSQSRHYSKEEVPPKERELHDAYERRTWRHRMHVTKDGLVFIPPMVFANAVKQAAKRLGLRVPGKGQKTYTKSFEAGVMVIDPLVLDVRAEDVPADELFVPSDGVRGSGKRVTKLFPRIDAWGGTVDFYILDPLIDVKVFQEVLEYAGKLVGIGRFRPESCGFYGRFTVAKLEWLES